MRVAILVPTGQQGIQPQDVLRAEYLSAAVRTARHEPRCAVLRYPPDPGYVQALLTELDPHLLVFYASPDNAEVIPPLTETAFRHDGRRPQFLVGPWPTLAPELAIQCGPINGLIRGEADLSLGRLLNSLAEREQLKKVPGLWLRRANAQTHQVPPGSVVAPDQLPVPDFLGFDWPKLAALRQGSVPVEASRGALARSLFHHSGDTAEIFADPEAHYRLRPVPDILRDIQCLRMRIDPLRLEFVDELFPADDAWLREFVESYRREVGLPFTARLSSELHTPKKIDRLARAGMNRIVVQLECGDETLRKQHGGAHLENAHVRDLAETAKDCGCQLHMEVFLGLPQETREQMDRTLELLRSLPFETAEARTFAPIPGTKIFKRCEELGLVRPGERQGTRETLVRNSRLAMDLGELSESVHRLNLERQIDRCPSKHGYYSFVDHAAAADHRLRRFGSLAVGPRDGKPALLMAVPAESGYRCFVEPESEVNGGIELITDATGGLGGRVQVEVTFQPEGGGAIKLFSARLTCGREPRRLMFREAIPSGETLRGVMTFVARDAGGGDGLTVAWIDPVLERVRDRKSSAPVHPRLDSSPATPKPVPTHQSFSLESEPEVQRRPVTPSPSRGEPAPTFTQPTPKPWMPAFASSASSEGALPAVALDTVAGSGNEIGRQLVTLMQELSDKNERINSLERELAAMRQAMALLQEHAKPTDRARR